MDRIAKICSYLDECKSFADVACDHGYCAQYMLKNGLCESAVVSDISEKSLSKARSLLAEYISSGKCTAVCCDGLDGIAATYEQVLIAGIGGEEIVKILRNAYIPKSFIFQPMKNAEILRAYLLENGCEMTADDIFTDGKNYYFIIKGKGSGKRSDYSAAQIKYGRDSFSNDVFYAYLKEELAKKKSYLLRDMTGKSREELKKEIYYIEGVLNGEIK